MDVPSLLFANNATSRLYQNTDAASGTVRVESGDGDKFPNPTGGKEFTVTLEDRRTGQVEICLCTSRSGDILTVMRGQEGTVAQDFALGATVSNRLTAGTMQILIGAAGVPEAPNDGKIYGRQSVGWTETVTKVQFDGVNTRVGTLESEMNAVEAKNVQQDLRLDEIEGNKPDDAPADGAVYARQNNAWVQSVSKVTFDTAIADLSGRTATLEADMTEVLLDNATQDAQITALQAQDVAHDSQIAALQSATGDNAARLDAVEAGQVVQDGQIADLELTKLDDAPSDGEQYVRQDGAWTVVDIPPGTLISETPPPTPETGQLWWQPSTGNLSIWDGDSWELAGGSPVAIADTPPSAPSHGDLWWESDSGTLLIWYDDGDSSQWVEVTTAGPPGAPGPLTSCTDAPPVSPQVGQMWWESDSGRLYIWFDDGNSTQWVQISGPTKPTGFMHWPAGCAVDWWGPTAPAGTLLCYGQAISRTTYAALFAVLGTTYGVGDGSTTFNLPDTRGRVMAGKDDMGGTAANRLIPQASGNSLDGRVLGAGGGGHSVQLATGHLPAHVHNPTYSGSVIYVNAGGGGWRFPITADGTGSALATTSVGSDLAHNNVQPTIVCNKLITTGGV